MPEVSMQQILQQIGKGQQSQQNEEYFTKSLAPIQREALAMVLKEKAEKYNEHTPFVVGDIIEFKPGMSNLKYPATNHVGIVMRLIPLGEQVRGAKESSSAHYCDIQDMEMAIIDPDGDFNIFTVNSKRFQLAQL